MKGVLRTIGCFWFAFVLVSLIWSTSIDGMREFIASEPLAVYLALWFAALAPGGIMIYASEKASR